MLDLTFPVLERLDVLLPDYLLDDRSELGPVAVGDVFTNFLELWHGRDWAPAELPVPGATALPGGLTRITAIARRTREGFYLVCGPAWVHVYTGETCVYDAQGVGHWLAPVDRPLDGQWVTCEGQLTATYWSGAEEDFASLEGASFAPSGSAAGAAFTDRTYPPACGWTVQRVDGAGTSVHAVVDALSLPH